MIKGVIFDMDGLMFDTERIWATLWKPALATLGLPYKEGLDAAARGSAGDSMPNTSSSLPSRAAAMMSAMAILPSTTS